MQALQLHARKLSVSNRCPIRVLRVSRAAGSSAAAPLPAINGLVHNASAAAMPDASTTDGTSGDVTAVAGSLPSIASVYPEQYEELLQEKLCRVKDLFQGFKLPEVEVFRSKPSHFRMRTEFRIWHQDNDTYYVMFAKPEEADGEQQQQQQQEQEGAASVLHTAASSSDQADAAAAAVAAAGGDHADVAPGSIDSGKLASPTSPAAAVAAAAVAASSGSNGGSPAGKKKSRKQRNQKAAKIRSGRVRVDAFPIANELINALMPLLLQQLLASPILREQVFTATFHTTMADEAMITLAYHKPLDDTWQEAARKLRSDLVKALGDRCRQLHIIGRSRKQKICLDADYVTDVMEVEGRQYQYRQMEGAFSQPNGGVAQHMLSWALRATRGNSAADLLELYCGNGNFTIPLAGNFRRVVATEVSKTSVDAARHNIEVNGVDNIFIARMSSEDFTSTWKVKGSRERLKGLDWEELRLTTLLVDPPRAGLDADTVQLLQEFEQVLYISCNPETLAANLREVMDSHEIVQMAAFDQFPYTHHLECGVLLKRRQT